MIMRKILIIEDDRTFAETLKTAIEAEGFQVDLSHDGEEGLRLTGRRAYDLLVLDVALPGRGGFDVCRELRAKENWTPLIMISGQKKEEIDKVLGLELGADDYLQKPFGARELLARIHAVLRRGTGAPGELEECAFGDVRLDFRTQTATKGGRTIHLTAREFALLRLLAAHEDEVVGRDRILNEVWGYERFPTTRTVDTFIHNLRRKIEDDPARPTHLLTVPWSGYKFKK
jgi:DNA-binding response OmpR family regulator